LPKYVQLKGCVKFHKTLQTYTKIVHNQMRLLIGVSYAETSRDQYPIDGQCADCSFSNPFPVMIIRKLVVIFTRTITEGVRGVSGVCGGILSIRAPPDSRKSQTAP
jgi:hypothetical protein